MEIDNSKDEIDLINVADEILEVYQTKKTLIYSLHTVLDQFELHLDSITKRYKAMTITLLLATCAAVGFLFSTEFKDLQINKLIVVSLVAFSGIIGITSIWYLDIQVFHRFWGAFFVEEVKMEKNYPFLIDIGDVAVSLDNIRARIFGNGNFYIAVNLILIIIIIISLLFLSTSYLIKGFIILAVALLSLLMIKLMKRACSKLQKSLEMLLSLDYNQTMIKK